VGVSDTTVGIEVSVKVAKYADVDVVIEALLVVGNVVYMVVILFNCIVSVTFALAEVFVVFVLVVKLNTSKVVIILKLLLAALSNE
jgi:hypothetical protein